MLDLLPCHFAGVVNGIACYTLAFQRLCFARECSNRSGDEFLRYVVRTIGYLYLRGLNDLMVRRTFVKHKHQRKRSIIKITK